MFLNKFTKFEINDQKIDSSKDCSFENLKANLKKIGLKKFGKVNFFRKESDEWKREKNESN